MQLMSLDCGHGNRIEVTIDKDIVTVRDYGQGFLINEIRDDGNSPRSCI